MMRACARRARAWALSIAIALDQLACVILMGPKFVLAGGDRPNPDETISSRVGRYAVRGKRWALACEVVINALFSLLGERDHCRSHIEADEPPVKLH